MTFDGDADLIVRDYCDRLLRDLAALKLALAHERALLRADLVLGRLLRRRIAWVHRPDCPALTVKQHRRTPEAAQELRLGREWAQRLSDETDAALAATETLARASAHTTKTGRPRGKAGDTRTRSRSGKRVSVSSDKQG